MFDDYFPKKLPCGKIINRGRTDQCCATECPDKTPKEIDDCYKKYKGEKKINDYY